MIMKSRLAAFAVMMVVGGFVTSRAPVAQSAAPKYTLVDLGTLAGGGSSYATAINNLGEVVGEGTVDGAPYDVGRVFHAFRWKDVNGNGVSDPGEMIDLGAPSGGASVATGINDAGQVVGSLSVNDSATGIPILIDGFLQTPAQNGGALQDFQVVFNPGNAPSGSTTESGLLGINSSGDILGWAWDYYPQLHGTNCPFVLSRGKLIELPYYIDYVQSLRCVAVPQVYPFLGYQMISIYAGNPINNKGQVAATSQSSPLLFDSYTKAVKILGSSGSALSVNDHGDAVGYIVPPLWDHYHPVLWKDGATIDLGLPQKGRVRSRMESTNRGEVVGDSDGGGGGAFIWRDANGNGVSDPGEMVTLESLTFANAINDLGQIAGSRFVDVDGTGHWQATCGPTDAFVNAHQYRHAARRRRRSALQGDADSGVRQITLRLAPHIGIESATAWVESGSDRYDQRHAVGRGHVSVDAPGRGQQLAIPNGHIESEYSHLSDLALRLRHAYC